MTTLMSPCIIPMSVLWTSCCAWGFDSRWWRKCYLHDINCLFRYVGRQGLLSSWIVWNRMWSEERKKQDGYRLFFLNSRWQTQRGWKRNAGSINIFYCSSILTRTCFKTLFFTSETVRSMQFERIRLGENQCKTSLYVFKMKLKVMGTKQREREKNSNILMTCQSSHSHIYRVSWINNPAIHQLTYPSTPFINFSHACLLALCPHQQHQ